MNEKAEITADMVKNLSILLMEKDKDMTMKEALSTVFQSDTYQKLMNEKTHFCLKNSVVFFNLLIVKR